MPAGDMPAGGRGAAFQYPAGELITSSLSNKGNATAFGQDNTFRVLEQNAVRIIDNKGNLLFSGTGPEAARQAVEIGKNLSDTLGNKAGWTIQTGERTINPDGSVGGMRYYDVANEKVNKSTLDKIAGVVGTALPIAVGFIPGLQGVGAVLASAGAGGVGAALRGQDILKGTIMGGLSAAGGQYLSGPLKGAGLGANAARAVGTGIGATAGGVATGQSLGDALLGGVTSGGLSYLGGEVFGDRGGTPRGEGGGTGNIGDSGVQLGDIVATARIPNFSGAAFNTNFFDRAQMDSEGSQRSIAEGGIGGSGVELNGLDPDAITVTGRRLPNFSGSAFTPSFFDSASDFAVKSDTDQQIAEEEAPTEDEILVKGTRGQTTGSSNFAVSPTTTDSGLTKDEIEVIAKNKTDTGSSTAAVGGPEVDPEFLDDIDVEGKRADEKDTGGGLPPPADLLDQIKDAEVKEDLKEGRDDDKGGGSLSVKELLALLGLLGAAGGGGGGGTGTGTGTGGKLQPIFSAKLPTPGEGGSLKVSGLKGPTKGAAGTFSARPVTDWYRFGMGPAMDIPAGTDLSGATSPYAGYGPGTLGQETFKAVSGIPEQPTGMYAGGSMGYSRGSSRESFAVEGPGTGRSDDIPAVLSDGEYVIDAETVALLGDGSSKAGAKRLDELRVNIRKHKGRNLAKGKFSVNAKRPEKYLSGGRA